MKSVTLDDVVQDECGYQLQFNDITVGVDTYDDIEEYANNILDRMGDDVLRAVLVLKWIRTNAVGATRIITDGGGIMNG